MSDQKKSTDPKYPPEHELDEEDEEESWPDAEELRKSIEKWMTPK